MFNKTEYQRQWRSKNRDKVRATEQRYKNKDRAEYNRKNTARSLKCLLRKQEERAGRPKPQACELCGTIADGVKIKICYDHDHLSGKFRGWLCTNCNSGLGQARDNPAILRKMAEYLEQGGIPSTQEIDRVLDGIKANS